MKNLYTNGQKLKFFSELLEKAEARVAFLTEKVANLKTLDPNERTGQDWSSKVSKEIAELRAMISKKAE